MLPHLPDEILKEILAPVLRVPDEKFRDTSYTSPFFTHSESTSAVLVICKSWLRVSTPLLYNVVILRSKAQARALEYALKGNELLGTFIRKLRVEGGLGPSMYTVISRAPHITDLWLAIRLWSSDVVSGLCRGLPTMNPRTLILFDSGESQKRINAATRQLLATLATCLKKWTHLETLRMSRKVLDNLHIRYAEIAEAVGGIPCLKTLVLIGRPHDPRTLLHLSRNKSLERIRIVTVSKPYLEGRLADDKVRVPVLYESPYEKHNNLKISSTTATNPTAPTLTLIPPLVTLSLALDAAKQDIFTCIIYHTINKPGNKLYSAGSFAHRLGLVERSTKAVPANIALVSRLFRKLALQELYRYTIISSRLQLEKMARDIKGDHSLGAHVRSLVFASTSKDFDSTSEAALQTIIAHTPNLQELDTHAPEIRVLELTILSKVASASLSKLTSAVFPAHTGICRLPFTIACPAEVLCNFTALRSLEWFHIPISFLKQVSLNSLANLSHLTFDVEEASFLKFLRCLDLHALKHVATNLPCTKEEVMLAFYEFLEIHGPKLESIAAYNIQPSCYSLCPAMTVLQVHTFDPTIEPHANLTKVVIGSNFSYLHQYNKSAFRVMFDQLYAVNFGMLYPALREVQVHQCRWPMTEHEMEMETRSLWVKWSEKLAQWNIKLTDLDGKHWRPRLK